MDNSCFDLAWEAPYFLRVCATLPTKRSTFNHANTCGIGQSILLDKVGSVDGSIELEQKDRVVKVIDFYGKEESVAEFFLCKGLFHFEEEVINIMNLYNQLGIL